MGPFVFEFGQNDCDSQMKKEVYDVKLRRCSVISCQHSTGSVYLSELSNSNIIRVRVNRTE